MPCSGKIIRLKWVSACFCWVFLPFSTGDCSEVNILEPNKQTITVEAGKPFGRVVATVTAEGDGMQRKIREIHLSVGGKRIAVAPKTYRDIAFPLLGKTQIRREEGYDKHPWLYVYIESGLGNGEGPAPPKRVHIGLHNGRIETRMVEQLLPDKSWRRSFETYDDDSAGEAFQGGAATARDFLNDVLPLEITDKQLYDSSRPVLGTEGISVEFANQKYLIGVLGFGDSVPHSYIGLYAPAGKGRYRRCLLTESWAAATLKARVSDEGVLQLVEHAKTFLEGKVILSCDLRTIGTSESTQPR